MYCPQNKNRVVTKLNLHSYITHFQRICTGRGEQNLRSFGDLLKNGLTLFSEHAVAGDLACGHGLLQVICFLAGEVGSVKL